MNFKEMLQDDINIFINSDEFAEVVNIGGKQYTAVLTYSDEKNISLYEGMVKDVDLILSLQHDDELFKLYKETVAMDVNRDTYLVNKVHSVEGMLTFYLLKTQGR